MRKEWQDKDHNDGDCWTLEDLIERAKYNKDNNLDGPQRMGVRENPYFNFKVKNIVFPVYCTPRWELETTCCRTLWSLATVKSSAFQDLSTK
jgi:hypothetical protein